MRFFKKIASLNFSFYTFLAGIAAPYAPNLNLIERLWRFMNKKVRNNKYYEKFAEFESAIYNFF